MLFPSGSSTNARVIVLVVVGAGPRRTVVATSGRERGGVERIDGGAVGPEGDVHRRARLVALAEPEVGVAARLETDVVAELAEHLVAERRERFQVEGLRCGDVADVERDVVEHSAPPG